MGQDEGMYQQYIPLALHLAEDHFLMHQSKDVQLLIACCIADVLRVYAPEAPYKDAEQVNGYIMKKRKHLKVVYFIYFFFQIDNIFITIYSFFFFFLFSCFLGEDHLFIPDQAIVRFKGSQGSSF